MTRDEATTAAVVHFRTCMEWWQSNGDPCDEPPAAPEGMYVHVDKAILHAAGEACSYVRAAVYFGARVGPAEDKFTNTVEDAAKFEQLRGEGEWDDRPGSEEL